jgi:hypothetical protein
VCPLIYNHSANFSKNNGVFQGYKGYQDIAGQTSGFVSSFQQPTGMNEEALFKISMTNMTKLVSILSMF